MISNDIILLLVYLILITITVITLIFYLPRLIFLHNKNEEVSNIIKNMMNELRNRSKNQDNKILDQEVKLEILELKLNKIIKSNNYVNSRINIKKDKTIKNYEKNVDKSVEKSPILFKSSKNLTVTENEIISHLTKKECNSSEIQILIKKTREHTSRLLKELVNKGFIVRNDNTRPFTYKINKE
jgi:hypothetical protein